LHKAAIGYKRLDSFKAFVAGKIMILVILTI